MYIYELLMKDYQIKKGNEMPVWTSQGFYANKQKAIRDGKEMKISSNSQLLKNASSLGLNAMEIKDFLKADLLLITCNYGIVYFADYKVEKHEIIE